MACTSIRGRWLVVVVVVSLVVPASLAAPAAAQITAEQKTAAAVPADEDPFGAPAGKAKNAQAHQADVPFAGPAAPAARPNAPVDIELEAKIRHELEEPTDMEFVETPLQDAVAYLKDLHGIEIQWDTKALEDAGLASDTPISRELKGVSLGAALRLILGQHNLTCVVRDGVLLITTPAAVKKTVELRVYNVHDLLQENGDVEKLVGALELTQMQPADVATYRDVIAVRASIAQHEAVADLLDEMRLKLKQSNE